MAKQSRTSESPKIIERWLAFNIRGEGIYRSSRNAKYSYTGPIYYSHGWPIARLVKLPDDNWACLNKHSIYPKNPVKWAVDGGPKKAIDLKVPDVGAFSPYDGDWIDDAALHERLRTLWMKVAAYQIELAIEMAFPTLVSSENSPMGEQRTLRTAVQTAIQEYTAYSKAFKLRWGPFPPIYMANLKQVIEDRKRNYFSPTEVAKRERAIARAGAKTAFGLDNRREK